MSQPFVVPVSRRLCGSLCLRSGPLTSLDLALWFGCVADALILVDDPDEEGDDLRSVWAIEDAAPLFMAGRTLLEATGLRSHGQLVRPFERLAESVVSLGLADDFTHRLWQGWEATPIYRGNEIDRGVVSGILLAQAMISGEPFPLSVNVSALARFGCRHSGLVYLRALAWLAGAPTPERWARTAPGKRVSLSVPLPDLHRALGVDLGGYKEWNRVLGTAGRGGAVHADLETAGIRLRTEWELAGYGLRRVPVGLRITVTRIERAARVPSRPRLKVKRRPQASSSSSISAT